jgi:predicted peroxiredoxin
MTNKEAELIASYTRRAYVRILNAKGHNPGAKIDKELAAAVKHLNDLMVMAIQNGAKMYISQSQARGYRNADR